MIRSDVRGRLLYFPAGRFGAPLVCLRTTGVGWCRRLGAWKWIRVGVGAGFQRLVKNTRMLKG